MSLHIKFIIPCLLGFLKVVQGIVIESLIVLVISRIHGSARPGILVKAILYRVDRIVANELVSLPEISHLIVIPRV